MSGTPTTVDKIMTRLTADSDLTSLLVGGIYSRPLKRGGYDSAGRLVPPGATPDAFAGSGQSDPVRPAAVVTDGTEEAMPLGPGAAFQSFPWVYLYAEPHASGKATIANAWDLMFGLLHTWHFATANGQNAEVQVIGRLATLDDPDDAKRVLGGMRLQVTSLWRVME